MQKSAAQASGEIFRSELVPFPTKLIEKHQRQYMIPKKHCHPSGQTTDSTGPENERYKLLFYSQLGKKDDKERTEIDFLTVPPFTNAAGKPRVCPVEVKLPKQYRTTSLDKFKATFSKKIGIQYVLYP